jgi:hypothetical protein
VIIVATRDRSISRRLRATRIIAKSALRREQALPVIKIELGECVGTAPRTRDVCRYGNQHPRPQSLAAVKAGTPVEPIDSQRRITAKVRRAIDLLATGKCKQIIEGIAVTVHSILPGPYRLSAVSP